MMIQPTSSEEYQPDECTFLVGYNRIRRYGTTQSQSTPATPSAYTIYQVKADDTLERIALKHNCSVSSIVRANKLWSPNALFMKEFIRIPIFNTQGGSSSQLSYQAPKSQSPKSTKRESVNDGRVNGNNEKSMKDILQRIDKNISSFKDYEISSDSVVFDSKCN